MAAAIFVHRASGATLLLHAMVSRQQQLNGWDAGSPKRW